MLLGRVLGRDHEEGVRQDVPDAVDGDLPLAHRLEQGALGARRGPVYLVGQQHVGEDRAREEVELASLLVVDPEAGDVAREQVGRALDPGELAAEGVREGLRERRLAEPGEVLDQEVAPGQQAGQHVLDHGRLAPERGVEGAPDLVDRPVGGAFPPEVRRMLRHRRHAARSFREVYASSARNLRRVQEPTARRQASRAPASPRDIGGAIP